ncbi:ABC transporter permease [Nocardioides donggukensis]|uniref:ABC transporter permease n=1 Tax=Nocardioides donggukensis TaxID=2774019 RepID=A0A927K408_9ACTN|nr:ABC transporter permease [Nocardioides donggukensis]MBD8869764.1 ABC transporter permease [Nocardioides donggukensis]
MGTYVVRRLLQFIPTTLGAIFLLHYLTSLGIQLTGNPARALFGDRRPSEAQLGALTEALGLADPCLTRTGDPCVGLYFDRLQKIFLQFDFGINFNRRPVTDIVADALPYTFKLVVIAIIFQAVVGITAGVLAGLRAGGFFDYFVKVSTVLLISVPVFVLGFVVRDIINVNVGNKLREAGTLPDWFTFGVMSPVYKPDYPIASLVVPGLVLGALSLATTARLTRTSILENVRSDYVRTARAKGLAPKRVIGVHTLRNSLIPVITYLGVDFGGLMGGAVVTEGIFGVPGIGREIFRATISKEPSVVLGIVTLLVLVFLIVNLIVDVLYAVLDPRIRYD